MTIGVDPLLTYLHTEKLQERKLLLKGEFEKKETTDGWSLKDDEIEVTYLSILKWILISYRLRLYSEATAVEINFD